MSDEEEPVAAPERRICSDGHGVPTGAAFCPVCGKPATTPEAVNAAKQGQKGCLWLCVAAVVVVVVLVVVGAMNGADDTESAADRVGAFDICKTFVKRQLRAPSTAKFRNFFEEDGEVSVTGVGDGPYTVVSSVDAQNGFGAQIRNDFTCVVTHTGGGNWHLDEMSIR